MLNTNNSSQITPSFFPSLDSNIWNRPLGSALNRNFQSDPWNNFGPTSLDLFDPFSQVDRLMNRNLSWLNEPDFLPPRVTSPLVPQKYRITLDCGGFNESSINTDVTGDQVIISATEGNPEQKGTGDYTIREFKKTYDLPNYVDKNKLVSFMTNEGLLVVEFPFKEDTVTSNLFPTVDQVNKKVSLTVNIPDNVDPNRLSVICRDNDLIIRADYRVKNEDGSTRSKVHYLRRATLPENTDFNSMKCEADQNNTLHVTAKLGPHHRKRVQIEFKNSEPIE